MKNLFLIFLFMLNSNFWIELKGEVLSKQSLIEKRDFEIKILEEKAKDYESLDEYMYAADCYSQIANIYKEISDENKVIEFQIKSLEEEANAHEKWLEYSKSAGCYSRIADIYQYVLSDENKTIEFKRKKAETILKRAELCLESHRIRKSIEGISWKELYEKYSEKLDYLSPHNEETPFLDIENAVIFYSLAADDYEQIGDNIKSRELREKIGELNIEAKIERAHFDELFKKNFL